MIMEQGPSLANMLVCSPSLPSFLPPSPYLPSLPTLFPFSPLLQGKDEDDFSQLFDIKDAVLDELEALADEVFFFLPPLLLLSLFPVFALIHFPFISCLFSIFPHPFFLLPSCSSSPHPPPRLLLCTKTSPNKPMNT